MHNILHIAPDEKFIDMALRDFERYHPGGNKLFVISKKKDLVYVKSSKAEVITQKKLLCYSFDDKFWLGIDTLILHSLCVTSIHIPSDIKVVWLGFGNDYYDLIPSIKLLTQETLKIYNPCWGFKNYIKSKLKKILMLDKLRAKNKIKLIDRIDIFCPIISIEYDLIKWPGKNIPKLGFWAYGTIEDDWGPSFSKFSSKERLDNNKIKVLLGNSSSPSVNHINGINKLFELNLIEAEIIIPLSYGNSDYKEKLKRKIKGKNHRYHLIYLETFLTFDEYMLNIMSCDVGIMPHKRQQGLGNINGLLYCGAKVFLDSENPLYSYFINNGVKVFSINELNELSISSKLNEDDVIFNREFIKTQWSRELNSFRISKLLERNEKI